MKLDCLVIQFAKFPRLGAVKTRLKSLLFDEGCLQLHLELMQAVNKNIGSSGLFQILSLDQLGQHDVITALGKKSPILIQQGDDLGQRMQHAMAWGLERAQKVIIVGSDCPVLSGKHLQKVSDELSNHDHVFIPAEDGGYVLIASTECFIPVYQGISWGSDKVFLQTQEKLMQGNKKAALLDALWDVDRPEDYQRLVKKYPNWPVM